MGFAERSGNRAKRTLVQDKSLDDATRMALWNVTHLASEMLERNSSAQTSVLRLLWSHDLGGALDVMPLPYRVWSTIKTQILDGAWFDALDVIESLVSYLKRFASSGMDSAIADAYNNRFEQYLVGHRFVGGVIMPASSSEESNAVEAALHDVAGIAGARHSLERAIELLADRANPDYANSVKESISAVEAVVKKMTGVGTLGAGLKQLESNGIKIHPALQAGWDKMYGWTSNDDGIRHAGIEPATVDQPLAKYMVVACAAFVSYLLETSVKQDAAG